MARVPPERQKRHVPYPDVSDGLTRGSQERVPRHSSHQSDWGRPQTLSRAARQKVKRNLFHGTERDRKAVCDYTSARSGQTQPNHSKLKNDRPRSARCRNCGTPHFEPQQSTADNVKVTAAADGISCVPFCPEKQGPFGFHYV